MQVDAFMHDAKGAAAAADDDDDEDGDEDEEHNEMFQRRVHGTVLKRSRQKNAALTAARVSQWVEVRRLRPSALSRLSSPPEQPKPPICAPPGGGIHSSSLPRGHPARLAMAQSSIAQWLNDSCPETSRPPTLPQLIAPPNGVSSLRRGTIVHSSVVERFLSGDFFSRPAHCVVARGGGRTIAAPRGGARARESGRDASA